MKLKHYISLYVDDILVDLQSANKATPLILEIFEDFGKLALLPLNELMRQTLPKPLAYESDETEPIEPLAEPPEHTDGAERTESISETQTKPPEPTGRTEPTEPLAEPPEPAGSEPVGLHPPTPIPTVDQFI